MKIKTLALFPFACCLMLAGCGEAKGDITLKGPNDGATIEIVRSEEKKYVDAMHQQAQGISNDYVFNNLNGDNVKIIDYTKKGDKFINQTNGQGVKLKLSFTGSFKDKSNVFLYHVATKEDFSDEQIIYSASRNIDIHSLKSNTTYYWKITNESLTESSCVKTFKTSDGWRTINNGLASNVRDMGGHMTKSGKRIKQGLIYRGSEMNYLEYTADGTKHNVTINDDTVNTCKNIIKVGTEIDFRGAAESGGLTSSNLGWDVEYLRRPITAYGKIFTEAPATYGKYMKDIFKAFITATESKSVYFHCMGGADRTGTVGFLLGGLLGMSYTDLVIDFELTSFSYNLREHDKVGQYSDFPSLVSGLKSFTECGNDVEISVMCEKYLTSSAVGLTANDISALKANLLEA